MSGVSKPSSVKSPEELILSLLSVSNNDYSIKSITSKIQKIESRAVTNTPNNSSSVTVQKSPRNYSLPKSSVVVASSDIPSISAPAQPIKAAAKSQIDRGLEMALNSFKEAFTIQAKETHDKYPKLILETIFLPSEESAIEKIKGLDEKTKKILIDDNLAIASQQGIILLDALRLAAIQGRFVLLRYLLGLLEEYQIDYQTDQEDLSWLNLAHFIALHYNGAFPLNDLPRIESLCTQANKSGTTPNDFVLLMSTPSPLPVPAFGADQPLLTPQEFQQLTHSNYWTRSCYTPGALLRLCFQVPTLDTPLYLATFLEQKITHYLTNPQPLCKLKIRKMEGSSIPREFQGRWECISSQEITKGEVLAHYTGTIISEQWLSQAKLSEKTLKICQGLSVDGGQGGSLAQFINHGFPNCAFFAHLYHGFPLIAVVALEDLKTNSPLFMHWPLYFKGETIVRATFNKSGIDQYLKETQNLRKIPFLQFEPDGMSYTYGDRGKTSIKKSKIPGSESDAMDAFSHKTKLEYLATYHLNEMKEKLDNPTFRWLAKGFIGNK